MAIKRITWVETAVTEHSAVVDVPDGVDLRDYFLNNGLAQLQNSREEYEATVDYTREFRRDEIDWDDDYEPGERETVKALNLTKYKKY